MKKKYIIPTTKTVQFKVRQMLTTSIGISTTGVNGTRGLDREDDEEDSFGW